MCAVQTVNLGTTVELWLSMNETIQQFRVDDLHAKLVRVRLEKSGLAAVIASRSTTPEHTKEAVKRYSVLIAELRKIQSELEQIRGRV